jgi:hypothetical protein
MASSRPTVVPIFATPFAVVPIPETTHLNGALKPLLMSRTTEAHRDPTLPGDSLSFQGREDLFEWQTKPVEDLKRALLAGLCTAVMEASSYAEAEFDSLGMQARARLTIVRPNGCISVSSAPMASWHALYCVAAPGAPPPGRADSGVLRLYAIRHGTMFIDASNWKMPGPFSHFHHNWRPVPGQMAVFPASIVHEIALNRGTEDLMLVNIRARFVHPGQAALPPW